MSRVCFKEVETAVKVRVVKGIYIQEKNVENDQTKDGECNRMILGGWM